MFFCLFIFMRLTIVYKGINLFLFEINKVSLKKIIKLLQMNFSTAKKTMKKNLSLMKSNQMLL